MTAAPRQPIFIGAMSGTSLDGLDLVAVHFNDNDQPDLIASAYQAYPADIKRDLHTLVRNDQAPISLLGETDTRLGQFYAATINDFCAYHAIDKARISAIGSHGQTIRHSPQGGAPYTLQIGDPNIIAALTEIDVVADFRRRDIALGGQGAPFACAYHDKVFRSPDLDRVIVNIGGIANLTHLPLDRGQPVIGFDSGPGNTLLDEVSRRHLEREYDQNGNFARSGNIHTGLVEKTLQHEPYFSLPPPKSTGTDYFSPQWLEKSPLASVKEPADLLATLVELVSLSIARAIEDTAPAAGEIYVCGGGAHNYYLMERLQHHCERVPVTSTEILGLHPDWVEAVTFAWLAQQTLERKPANLPSVTKAKKFTILGAVYFHRQSACL